jgi:hypothetical protein
MVPPSDIRLSDAVHWRIGGTTDSSMRGFAACARSRCSDVLEKEQQEGEHRESAAPAIVSATVRTRAVSSASSRLGPNTLIGATADSASDNYAMR